MEFIFILFLGIQSNQQERIKRKANLEATIKQTAARLERAQLLSYSLEEESERWKANLIEVDKSLQVLVGNTVIVVRSSAVFLSGWYADILGFLVILEPCLSITFMVVIILILIGNNSFNPCFDSIAILLSFLRNWEIRTKSLLWQ